MIKKILLVVIVLVVVLVGVIMTRPADFTVTRSKTVTARPDVVYAHLVDFHRWQAWSPWERLDPNMKRDFSGAPSGQGAVYSWVGNSDVGEGRMTITDAQPNQRVGIKLDFLEPMAMTSNTEFRLTPSGQGGTKVDWTMTGRHGFIGKGMSLFMNMDKMVGNDFEKGLNNLDSVSKASAPLSSDATSGG